MAVVLGIMARRVSGSKVVEVGFGISCFICRFVVVFFFTSYWLFFFYLQTNSAGFICDYGVTLLFGIFFFCQQRTNSVFSSHDEALRICVTRSWFFLE
jgi:hypothetical protein